MTASRSVRLTSVASFRSAMRQHLLDFLAQGFRVERLDDVVGDAGLLGSHHVLHLAFGGDHDERRALQPAVGAHLLQKLQSGHRRHVPVADHQAETAAAQLVQRFGPVGRFLDVVELNLLEQIADYSQHRLVVVHDEDVDRLVHRHGSSLFRFWYQPPFWAEVPGVWWVRNWARPVVTSRALSGFIAAITNAAFESFMRSTRGSSTVICRSLKITAASRGFIVS